MKNYVSEGDVVEAAAPYARTSGQGAKIGAKFFGVACNDVANGATGRWKRKGTFDLDCVTTDVFAFGDQVFWDNTNKTCTATASGNLRIGVAHAAKASGPATVRVGLDGFIA